MAYMDKDTLKFRQHKVNAIYHSSLAMTKRKVSWLLSLNP